LQRVKISQVLRRTTDLSRDRNKVGVDLVCIDLYNKSGVAAAVALVKRSPAFHLSQEMTMHNRVLFAALCGGLVAGTLDIGVAALLNSVSPLVVLAFIASGILGKAAYQAGAAGLVLGLALQWAMSFAIALIYGLGRERIGVLRH
jgi:hypothetical protein